VDDPVVRRKNDAEITQKEDQNIVKNLLENFVAKNSSIS
jgi:hypothetical protein